MDSLRSELNTITTEEENFINQEREKIVVSSSEGHSLINELNSISQSDISTLIRKDMKSIERKYCELDQFSKTVLSEKLTPSNDNQIHSHGLNLKHFQSQVEQIMIGPIERKKRKEEERKKREEEEKKTQVLQWGGIKFSCKKCAMSFVFTQQFYTRSNGFYTPTFYTFPTTVCLSYI